jgi:hypothetical protein
MQTSTGSQGLGELIATHLVQFAYVCPDMDAAQRAFADKLGIERFAPLGEMSLGDERALFGIAYSGKLFFELIQPLTDEGIYEPYLRDRGDQVAVFHHVGIRVDDYDRVMADIKAAGYDFIYSDDRGTYRFGYADTTADLGHMVEVIWTGPEVDAFWDQIKRGDF